MASLILFYGVFLIGYLLHMMLQVDAIVRAANNAAESRFTVIEKNLFVLLGRFFISLIVLAVIRSHPEYLASLLSWAGVTVGTVTISTSSWIFSGMFGYTIDSLLTFIPVLKNYVPPLNGSDTPKQ